MDQTAELTPADIRARRADAPKLRDQDLAENLGLSEAKLVAAHLGAHGPRCALRPRPSGRAASFPSAAP